MSAAPNAEGYADVVARIARAAQAAGRDPADVTLAAVSKTQPWEAIQPVLDAGQRVFGENRVQEAQERWTGKADGRVVFADQPADRRIRARTQADRAAGGEARLDECPVLEGHLHAGDRVQ